ncbi:helix-turn-helix domain-containing protein [Reyranella sp. MMS21-HV4-11]|uniref:Helix-turn-helix domain-containing protein n=1 Tax=Reyranella humidisoli TaxID=2849149 RepID=A0ABS6IPD2_9HYPH|nr:helix-turn-helix domain-containing protein [Reyranella sp. MMS21-HV4-11]MBU8875870.1 helix-turn-helix domain-containing protein [Reyranella sp. MMS21-HV4-11]
MAPRRINPRLAKLHRNYTAEEVASLLDVNRQTVWKWLKIGLKAIDGRRPILIMGEELRRFLYERRAKRKRPTPPGMIYCLGCREPRSPAGNMVDFIPLSPTTGNLQGICPTCESMLYRRINLGRIEDVRGNLDVTFTQPGPRITDCANPSVNHYSDNPGTAHADA